MAVDARLDPGSSSSSATPAPRPSFALQIEAAGQQPPAGLLLLAPPGRELLTIMIDQYRYLNAQGALDDEELERAEASALRLRAGDVGPDNIILFAKPSYWDSVNFWKPWRDYTNQAAPALIRGAGLPDHGAGPGDLAGRSAADQRPAPSCT
jgi:hypothetical protein